MKNNNIHQQIAQAREILKSNADKKLKDLARQELKNLFLNQKQQGNIILEIRAGTGGDEAELFAGQLWRMYQRFSQLKNYKVKLLDSNFSPLGGVKSLTAEIEGEAPYNDFIYESGVHRVQRVPVTEKSGRLHTSAASVAVLPVVQDKDIEIADKDIRVDVYRSKGHGGQGVNTTDSAVRITHLSTGLVVTCQDERSQLKNKTKALMVLRAKLKQMQEEERAKKRGETRRYQIGTGDRSEKIRTYNFPQSRVTDHRIGKSWRNLEEILNGELSKVIEALKNEEAERFAQISS
jgi:peptide chain release factor 1